MVQLISIILMVAHSYIAYNIVCMRREKRLTEGIITKQCENDDNVLYQLIGAHPQAHYCQRGVIVSGFCCGLTQQVMLVLQSVQRCSISDLQHNNVCIELTHLHVL